MPKRISWLVIMVFASLLFSLSSCDFGSDENKNNNIPLDSIVLDSSAIENSRHKKNYAVNDSSLTDTSIFGQLSAAILKLPEMKRESYLLDSISKGKSKLVAKLSDKPLETENLYNVQVGEKMGNNFKSRFDFYIDKDTREIKIYDPGEDRLITLDEWRKINE